LGPNLHVELRATYLFATHRSRRIGFAPMVFVAAGLAKVDGHVTSTVTLNNVLGSQPVNVWVTKAPGSQRSGPEPGTSFREGSGSPPRCARTPRSEAASS